MQRFPSYLTSLLLPTHGPYSFTVISPFSVSGPSAKLAPHPHPPIPHLQVVYTPTITLKHPIMFCGPTISLKSSISLLSSMRHLIIEISFPPSYQLRSSAWFLQQAAICGSLGCSCQLLCPVLGICTSSCDLLLVLYFPLDFSAQKWDITYIYIYMYPYIPHILTVKLYRCSFEWSEEENLQWGSEVKYSGVARERIRIKSGLLEESSNLWAVCKDVIPFPVVLI